VTVRSPCTAVACRRMAVTVNGKFCIVLYIDVLPSVLGAESPCGQWGDASAGWRRYWQFCANPLVIGRVRACGTVACADC